MFGKNIEDVWSLFNKYLLRIENDPSKAGYSAVLKLNPLLDEKRSLLEHNHSSKTLLVLSQYYIDLNRLMDLNPELSEHYKMLSDKIILAIENLPSEPYQAPSTDTDLDTDVETDPDTNLDTDPTITHEMNALYSANFKMAKQYFDDNPTEKIVASTKGFIFKYEKIDDLVLRREHYILGEGTSGATKLSTDEYGKLWAIKRITCPTDYDYELWKQEIIDEAKINFDLRLAASETPIFKKGTNGKDKAYITMPYLNTTLTLFLEQNPSLSLEKRLNYSINLLLSVNDLHTGGASRTGVTYVHNDIKPDNILLNNKDIFIPVDFGMTTTNVKAAPNYTMGTPLYLPVHLYLPDQGHLKGQKIKMSPEDQYKEYVKAAQRQISIDMITHYDATIHDATFTDKIATLKVIFFDFDYSNEKTKEEIHMMGLLTKEQFAKLPAPLKEMLDATDVKSRLLNSKNESMSYIAAALILYNQSLNDPKMKGLNELLTRHFTSLLTNHITSLCGDVSQQNIIICEHKIKQAFKNTHLDKEDIDVIQKSLFQIITEIKIRHLKNIVFSGEQGFREKLEKLDHYRTNIDIKIQKNKYNEAKKEFEKFLTESQKSVGNLGHMMSNFKYALGMLKGSAELNKLDNNKQSTVTSQSSKSGSSGTSDSSESSTTYNAPKNP